eukprot:gene18965-24775_t
MSKNKNINDSDSDEETSVQDTISTEEISDDENDSNDDDDSSEGFEQQSSSDESVDSNEDDNDSDNNEETNINLKEIENNIREWDSKNISHDRKINKAQEYIHTDDLSSDDEDITDKNTIGRVPLHWYDAYDHIGYNISGEKLIKRKGKDRIDLALSMHDDPLARRTVYDMYNDKEVVLSDRDLEIIRRIQAGTYAHPEHNDMPDYVDYESSKKEIMPLSAMPEPKRRFLPSKWEMMRVMKIVKAIKEGRYVDKKQLKDKEKETINNLYLIWNDQEDEIVAESLSLRAQYHLPAPKIPLPGHAESYNPPIEYLLSEEEIEKQNELAPKDRFYNFIPKKHDCLRHVTGYENLIKERFERCLDLYLCPRKLKRRLNIDPETLIPRLPKPKELKPYPNSLAIQFLGHTKAVRSISISPDGQYIVSGSDDGTVRLWEVDTSLCKYTWNISKNNKPINQVVWNPNPTHHIIAVIVDDELILITTGTGDSDSNDITESLLSTINDEINSNNDNNDNTNDEILSDNEDDNEDNQKKSKKNLKGLCIWSNYKQLGDNESVIKNGSKIGPRVTMKCKNEITKVVWHYKGDYLATVVPNYGANAIGIHQLSKAKSQFPFMKSPGNVQTISFHPNKPYLFIGTQQHVKVFHLIEAKLVKKLISGCKWISSIDIHPSGDHVIVGSFDRRVVWFDLDLSSTPYKTLKYHEKAVRDVSFHKRYPLMASSSDDGTVQIFHSMVYSDLTRNALIVPLKILRGHGVIGNLGVLACEFHPKQPWIFTAGVDGVINLFQDI